MLNLLVDTCVWLDIPKDPKQKATLTYLQELCNLGEVSLIVPRTVLDEFDRNKARIVSECGQSLSGVLKRAKEILRTFGTPSKTRKALDQLDDIDHKLPTLGEAAVETVGRIEKLLRSFPVVEATDEITLRAAKRGIAKTAPFHRGANSTNDAILIETYAAALANGNGRFNRFMFVTHNKKDFSQKDGDQRKPHPDLAPLFSKIKSRYFISLVTAIQRIRPDVRADLLEQEHDWSEEIRPISEVSDMIGELIDKVWYNRHKFYAYQIARGKFKVVKVFNQKRSQTEFVEEIWKGAQASARKLEQRYGKENLGPYTDFEWGMLNGKLSALRWALGDEWDMLDT